MTRWTEHAPSNIALIKYMGKRDPHTNIPLNPSLSYTLPHLTSTVRLTQSANDCDSWSALPNNEGTIRLSEKAITRFIDHLGWLKTTLNFHGYFHIESANNFPIGCGLASSASSFAALTKTAVNAISDLKEQAIPALTTIAQWSRCGSGSSCRSFFAPWAIWEGETVIPLALPYTSLRHRVIVFDAREKKVASTQAHQLIQHSRYFVGRTARAEARCRQLQQALQTLAWSDAFECCWEEFIDMHRLFETATPAFQYITPACNAFLHRIKHDWQHHGYGPLVTMDAGPNVHLLYRHQDTSLMHALDDYCLKEGIRVIGD